MGRGEKQHVFTSQIEITGRSRLLHQIPKAMHPTPLIRVLSDVLLEGLTLKIRDTKHQSHRLHQAILLAAYFKGRAGSSCDIAIAGAIDNRFGADEQGSGFGFENDSVDVWRLQHVTGEGVKEQLDVRSAEHLEGDGLKDLWVERHHETRSE